MSDHPQKRQSSSSKIKYVTAKAKITSLFWLYFSIRGLLLYFLVFDRRSVSIRSLLNLTQRGCLYLLYPNNVDHAIEQYNQFVQQELVFHYLVQKFKHLQCLSAQCDHKASIGKNIITDNVYKEQVNLWTEKIRVNMYYNQGLRISILVV